MEIDLTQNSDIKLTERRLVRRTVTTTTIGKVIIEGFLSIVASPTCFSFSQYLHADLYLTPRHGEEAVVAGIATIADSMNPVLKNAGRERGCHFITTIALELEITQDILRFSRGSK